MTCVDDDKVDAFIDLRSPYSYLAVGPARTLARDSGFAFDWWPYITDFRTAYGGEIADRQGRDVAKLKYLYMDCRRLAQLQGLTIRATTKLWDASLASKAFLLAKSFDRLWEFLDPLLKAFWACEFDLESSTQLEAALVAAGLRATDWQSYLATDADNDLTAVLDRATYLGIFGAPTFVFRGQLFWGGDRLELLGQNLVSASRAR